MPYAEGCIASSSQSEDRAKRSKTAGTVNVIAALNIAKASP